MEAGKTKGKSVAAKLDMSLDDLIASAPTNSRGNRREWLRGRGSFRGRGGFVSGFRRGRSITTSGMEIDEGAGRRPPGRFTTLNRFGGGFERRREGDLIQKRAPRGNWRGGRGGFAGSQYFYSNRRRSWNAGLALPDDVVMDVDENGTMSDGEIPTSTSIRRQLLLEGRRRANFGGGRRRQRDGCLIIVSGLDYSILQPDLVELFESIGPIEECWIDYDKTDRSLGTGGVVYQKAYDAEVAVREFDRRTIDGQMLRLELVENLNDVYWT